MLKALVSFGTRPEAIKLSPVIKVLATDPEMQLAVCSTGQHDQMLAQVLRFFSIVPDYDFKVMRTNQGLTDVCTQVMLEMQRVLRLERPDIVIVQGDTTSALATSMAAFHESVPVGHVEAGLRTYDLSAPFPEEGNRQLISRLAKLHFAPTKRNREALLREGIASQSVHVTGNTVIDSLQWTMNKLDSVDGSQFLVELQVVLPRLDNARRLILVTGHRRESFGAGLESICLSLLSVAQKNDDVEIVYPVHLNPNVSGPVHAILGGRKNIHLLAPVSYPAFVWLMMRSYLIITDSGGIQEEAPSLRRPVLVTRRLTERQEAIDIGSVKVVGFDRHNIVSEIESLLSSSRYYSSFICSENPYGDGKAAERILRILKSNISTAGIAAVNDDLQKISLESD